MVRHQLWGRPNDKIPGREGFCPREGTELYRRPYRYIYGPEMEGRRETKKVNIEEKRTKMYSISACVCSAHANDE